ncbi:MAG TPA: GNAT family protein [Mycobacteriales bacterium]|nr:GNAT family protein [Mycobacteriales bacterium]
MLTTAEPVAAGPLLLRALRPDDLDDLVALHADPDVVRYLPWPDRDREQVRRELDEQRARTALAADGDVVTWAVERDGGFAGLGVLFLRSTAHRQAEVGYVVAPAVQRSGVGSALARALVDLAVDRLGAHRVAARVDVRNTASRRLLAGLGFREEGVLREDAHLRGRWVDTAVCAVLAREWRG